MFIAVLRNLNCISRCDDGCGHHSITWIKTDMQAPLHDLQECALEVAFLVVGVPGMLRNTTHDVLHIVHSVGLRDVSCRDAARHQESNEEAGVIMIAIHCDRVGRLRGSWLP